MKNSFNVKVLSFVLAMLMIVSALFSCEGWGDSQNTGKPSKPTVTTLTPDHPCYGGHTDEDTQKENGYGLCDVCGSDVVETIDFYNFNDLHGKFEDSDSTPGVDEITSYLEDRFYVDDHVVLLSSGDMWQGGSSSNSTKGKIITEWMNYLGFEAMALGNHEFDWGSDAVRANAAIADFSILAINIYDNETGERADYCEASVMIERGGVQIGIIGAIGDCHNSIAKDKNKDFHFKTDEELTSLVEAESKKLRSEGADVIIYLLHSDDEDYDIYLSKQGLVDVVFEGHTHQEYAKTDAYGVSHVQNGGDNSNAMSHVELNVNFANGDVVVTQARYIEHSECSSYEGSPVVGDLVDKYWDDISWIYDTLGYNASKRNSTAIGNKVVELYYKAAIELWGDEYDIVLAGGQINVRSPYTLPRGDVSYSDLQMLLPFDNAVYLCTISGSNLRAKFINNTSKYRLYINPDFDTSKIQDDKTYYVVADSWTALYDWAACTVVELYDGNTFARDFLAEFIKSGGWSK